MADEGPAVWPFWQLTESSMASLVHDAAQRRLLDEKALSAELASAVLSDQRRKAVDDMKKRSVMTARSYDEFRHLVACAQSNQKPLSSAELASLGKPPKEKTYLGARLRKGRRVAGRGLSKAGAASSAARGAAGAASSGARGSGGASSSGARGSGGASPSGAQGSTGLASTDRCSYWA